MLSLDELSKRVTENRFAKMFMALYGSNPAVIALQKNRYNRLIAKFKDVFPDQSKAVLFSTPGRTEIGGNHTDHNNGRVLAAAVDLDAIAVAAPVADPMITIDSEGFEPFSVSIDDVKINSDEKYTSAALVRGICVRLKQLGYKIGGFKACSASNVPQGSGLSSSAAFEVLIVSIINHLYNNNTIDPVTAAQVSQWAENHYFGKPCGLMDQTTCSVGGFVMIDFKDKEKPVVKKVTYDFVHSGYKLVIVNTGGSHANLNDDYAAITAEMRAVAVFFKKQVLREVSIAAFKDNLAALRKKTGDRALLRAFHFFADDARVVKLVDALQHKKIETFFELIKESGRSSYMLLQNCYSNSSVHQQGIALALCVTEQVLKQDGSWRVHGGGFAGTIQVFVPQKSVKAYIKSMERVFGKGACVELMIRPLGAVVIR